jgi:hypothetical protein
MKLGQVEAKPDGQQRINQSAEVLIPWAQAKLLLYWLRLQVEAIEIQGGTKIPIRKDIIPPEIPALPESEKDNPDSVKMHDFATQVRAEFIASL